MSHIVRINPITGEELHYYKGQVNASNIPSEPISNPNHKRFAREETPYKKTIPNQSIEQGHYVTSTSLQFVNPLELQKKQEQPQTARDSFINPINGLSMPMPMSARPHEANTTTSQFINPLQMMNQQQQQTPRNQPPQTTSTRQPLAAVTNDNLSLIANASSIPALNFKALDQEDDEEKRQRPSIEKYKKDIDAIQAKIAELRDKNPIVAAAQQNKSARPQSSYRQGFQHSDSLNSPIIAYNNNKTKIDCNEHLLVEEPSKQAPVGPSPLASQLEAPRQLTFRVEDVDLINTLNKPLIAKKRTIYQIERVADLERLWINSSAITERSKQRQENQEKSNKLIENMVEERIITDQLSDPFKQNQQIVKTVYTARGNKFNVLDSRNNSTLIPSALTENVLSKRIKFNCRLVSPDGKLALRELFGILFLCDNSLTIYEFRILCGGYYTQMSGGSGQKSTALPFIARQVHKHGYGRKAGQDIDVWDLYSGSVLYIQTPDGHNYTIEVTEINEQEKEGMLTSAELQNKTLSPPEISQNIVFIKNRLKEPRTEIQLNDDKIVGNVRRYVHDQIANRAVEVYMNLSADLKHRAKKNGGLLSTQDLYDAFQEYSIKIHSEDLNIVWQVLDLEGTGLLTPYKVMNAYFGGMNLIRHRQFRSLVHKLDTLKTGFVQTCDIYKYYKANRHPKVKSGDMSESEMFEKFLGCFELINPMKNEDFYRLSTTTDTKSQLISYEQLEQYYNGLALAIDADEDFCQILKNSWNCF